MSSGVTDHHASTTEAQILQVGVATSVSLVYALIFAPLIFRDYKPGPLPGTPWFILLCAVGIVLMFIGILNRKLLRAMVDPFVDGWRQSESAVPVWYGWGRRTILYVLVVLSIVLLAWSTLPSGGTLTSPFSGALIAIALLSPFVAQGYKTPIVAFIMVMCAFWTCSGVVFSIPRASIEIPDLLTAVSMTVTNFIAIVLAVLVKRRDLKRQRANEFVG